MSGTLTVVWSSHDQHGTTVTRSETTVLTDHDLFAAAARILSGVEIDGETLVALAVRT